MKKYEIDSFDKLLNVVNKENFEAISTSLLMWLWYTVQFYDQVKKDNPELNDKANSQISRITFTWIDDGKHELKSIITRDQNTGEIKELKLKED